MEHGVGDFLAKLSTDAALRRACSDALQRGGTRAVVQLAAESGFNVRDEDLAQALAEPQVLDDQQLSEITGGMNKSELIQLLSNRGK
jgi:predicted ribosomally synthesized peptide with nif11-like leader